LADGTDRDGRILQAGSGKGLHDRLIDAFIAGFIGNSNFREGRVLHPAK